MIPTRVGPSAREASPTSRFQLTLSEVLWASIFYLLVSVAVFWPTIRDIQHAIVGYSGEQIFPGDNMFYVWQLWWFRHAVLTGQDPAFTHNLFALDPKPVLVSLDAFFAQAASLPLQVIVSALTTYNVLLIGSFVLGGATAYILAGTVTQSRLARFTAGFIFTFSTFHFFRATGHLAEATIEWLPFCAWRLCLFFKRPTPLNAALAALGVALVPLSAVYFGAYFALPFILALLGYQFMHDRTWFTLRNVAYLCGSLALAAAATFGVLHSFLQLEPSTAATFAAAQVTTVPFSGDGAAFFLPNPANPIFGPLTAPIYAKMLTAPNLGIEQGVYLGWIALGLAGVAMYFAVRGRSRGIVIFWLSVFLLGIAITVGPQLHVAGRSLVPLPFYNLFYGWSGLSYFRAPNRAVVLSLLAIAMLAAVGVDALFRSLALRRNVPAFLCTGIVLLLFASLCESSAFSMPYPSGRVSIAPVYAKIGKDTSDALLIDLPVVPSGYFEMLQSVHRKRLVGGGNVPRLTPEMEASQLDIPYVALFVPSFDSDVNLAGARQFDRAPKVAFAARLVERNIHYIVFHRIVDQKSDAWAIAFLRLNLGRPMYEGSGDPVVWHI